MGFFSKIIRKVTKPIKKVIKSPLGKAALIGGLGYLAGPSMAKMMGGSGNTFMGRLAGGGWKQALMGNVGGPGNMYGSKGPLSWLTSGGTGGDGILGTATKFISNNKVPLAIAGGSGILSAAAAGNQPSVDEAWASNQDTSGHDAYLNTRKYFPFGDTSSQYYTAPLYNQGGRVGLEEGGDSDMSEWKIGDHRPFKYTGKIDDIWESEELGSDPLATIVKMGLTVRAPLIDIIRNVAKTGTEAAKLIAAAGKLGWDVTQPAREIIGSAGKAGIEGTMWGLGQTDKWRFAQKPYLALRMSGMSDDEARLSLQENRMGEFRTDPELTEKLQSKLFEEKIGYGSDYQGGEVELYPGQSTKYAQGGRVKAQQGMYAGEGDGLASLPTDQMQSPVDQGVLDSGTTAQGQSDDAEFIALIQQLAAMGIPMEQLRGRTKQELVEMMIYVSSKVQGRGVQEDVAVEEQVEMAGGGDAEYNGWKNVYELNPDAASQHPRHQEFIVQYESEQTREPKTEGGDLFLKQSTEVLEGRPDGSSEFMTEEELQQNYPGLARGEVGSPVGEEIEDMREFKIANPDSVAMNQGGIMRTGYAMGSEHPVIPSKDGMQLDMRNTGGYQPHGKQEKHDDVRALLAQGEFVMTSDAVKGLGGGDRDEGAKKMYDMMHKLEAMA